MGRLQSLIGIQSDLGQVADALRQFGAELGAPVVGAYHLTCSDEAERECEKVFQQRFVRRLLPELKRDVAAPFRTINLGARYEWGAIRLTEDHFAAAVLENETKLIIAKINSHVGVRRQSDEEPEYGYLDRYNKAGSCCGALSSMFTRSPLPAVDELRDLFNSGGEARLALLADTGVVDPRCRLLLAAVLNARMQAYRAVMDVQEHPPAAPTIYLVVPCVSINCPGPDGEIVVGQFGVDCTGAKPQVKYSGLSNDPAAYRVRHDAGRVMIEDAHWPEVGS